MHCKGLQSNFPYLLTYDAKDVTNIGHEDDEQVHDKKQTQCNEDVTQPVEGLIGEQKLKNSPANLKAEEDKYRSAPKLNMNLL